MMNGAGAMDGVDEMACMYVDELEGIMLATFFGCWDLYM